MGKPDKDYVDVSASFNEVYSYDKDSDVVINNDPLLGKEKDYLGLTLILIL